MVAASSFLCGLGGATLLVEMQAWPMAGCGSLERAASFSGLALGALEGWGFLEVLCNSSGCSLPKFA